MLTPEQKSSQRLEQKLVQALGGLVFTNLKLEAERDMLREQAKEQAVDKPQAARNDPTA